jgi:hypothetical protein
MTHKIQLFLCLITMLSPGVALAASPVAYVYVQEDSSQNGDTAPSPISVYAAASDGKLTKIKGSPFQATGVLVGNNGKHIITLDALYLHSYPVSSAGVIGAQVSEINTQLYTGAGCAGVSPFQWALPSFAEMDHTGEYVYMVTNGTNLYGVPVQMCSALQTFKVSSSGLLTFQNNFLNFNVYNSNAQAIEALTLTGNSKFAILTGQGTNGGLVYTTLSRGSNGDLNLAPNVAAFYGTPDSSYPTPEPGSDSYYAWPQWGESPDPTDHLAVQVEDIFGCQSIPEALAGTNGAGCVGGNYYLASYTMNSEGILGTTNTWENMPIVACCSYNLMLNPAGNILAIGNNPVVTGLTQSGVQLFKFNGANPATPLGSPIVSTYGALFPMQWDKDNHLYALNSQSGRLHVWTVTSKGAVEVSGSPYTVPFCGYIGAGTDQTACTQTLIVRSN